MRFRVACLMVLLGACNKDDVGGGGTTNLKPTIGLDLGHIVGFAVGGGPSARSVDGAAMADSFQQLYAIDDQGNLVITTLTTSPDGDAGTTTASATPTSIFDTPKYVVFAFDSLAIGPPNAARRCTGVFMRKADGALYCYEGGSFDQQGRANARTADVQSNAGDLLFVHGPAMFQGGGTGVQRIDMASEPPPAESVVDDEAAMDFVASLDGDVLVDLDRGPVQQTRIYKKAGGIQNLVATRADTLWLEAGGHAFYYVYVDPVSSGTWDVAKATRQSDGSYVVSAQGTVPVASTTDPQPSASNARLVLSGSDVAYFWRGADIVELIGPTQGSEHVLGTLTGFATIADVRASASSLFVQGTDSAGNGGITRLDLPAFTATAILPTGEFSLTAISPSKTGELSFAGLRNSDGRRVIGKVPAGSTTYTLSSQAAPTVTYLQRMN